MSLRTPTLTALKTLVAALADSHEPGDSIRPADLRELTDDELAIVINHDDGIAYDAARPADWADILNSAVYVTHAERSAALATNLREALHFEVRTFLAAEVNTLLWERCEAFLGSETDRAMDLAGMRQEDFV